MGVMGGELRGLLEQARRAAQRRGQRLSTAHVLLVMLQLEAEAGRPLVARGVREADLISALKVVDEEPASALEVALERARKIAQALGDGGSRPIHLLLAMTREPRTAAHRCLDKIGAGAARVHEQALAFLAPVEAPRGRPAPARPTTPLPRTGALPPSTAARTSPPLEITHRSAAPVSPAAPPAPPSRTSSPAQIPPQACAPVSAPQTSEAQPSPQTPSVARPSIEQDLEADEGAPPAPVPLASRTPPAPRTPPVPRRAGSPRRANVRLRDGRQREIAEPSSHPERSDASSAFDLDRDKFPLLSAVGRNLTAAAFEDAMDPVVGRDSEIERLLDVLARRRANNPLLVGPPGVGKTAIVEGLALRIARGREKRVLAGVGLDGRILIELSAGSLVSGTGVRGALAERVRQLRAEIARAEGRVLLFLDEIHTVLGAQEGPDDLGHELKAALARGELPCIGATTELEYKRLFERDSVLARCFSRVDVVEPRVDDAIEILRGLAPRYEDHHGIVYAPEALRAAVELTVRFVPERVLPDKAIGVLDLAAARVRRRRGSVVDVAAIAEVIAEQAHVPAERLLMRDAERLLLLERHLEERVVGQRAPIARISHALRKAAAGFRGRRPLGTFLLLGPTGVGKTETAKAISDLLFPSSGMSRFDMSEFSEAHAVARLLGAPPGYVGHEDGGQLTEAVRRRPYQLLLLDEIEKAHPEVMVALLPLLDEGRLTDSRGRTVDFTNTVIVMTSNLGAERAAAPAARIGFDHGRADGDAHDRGAGERAIAMARKALPPELWNRIDEPLYFAALGYADVIAIARRMLDEVGATLEREHGIKLSTEESVVDALVLAGGFDASLGARPMRRTVGRLVEAVLAQAVLARDIGPGDRVALRGEGDRVVYTREGAADAAE